MNEFLSLTPALGAGVLLGAFFFGGLWWTVGEGRCVNAGDVVSRQRRSCGWASPWRDLILSDARIGGLLVVSAWLPCRAYCRSRLTRPATTTPPGRNAVCDLSSDIRFFGSAGLSNSTRRSSPPGR